MITEKIPTQNELHELLVISMWQPWASWVAWGWKLIETRTHARFQSLEGKRIGIHAAQRFDTSARHLANHYLSDGQARSAGREDIYPTGLLCTVFVRKHRLLTPTDAPRALIECDTPRYGLCLEAIHRIEPPLSCKGRQGIFRAICPRTVHGRYVTWVPGEAELFPKSVSAAMENQQ